MDNIGLNVKRLRQSKRITQEQLAEQLHISPQAISKWECGSALPDIQMLPMLADIFDVSLDELFSYKRGTYTKKEQLIRLMAANGVLTFPQSEKESFYLNTEHFTTNAQTAKIGSYFADCIRENLLTPDAILGLAYHGIAFSAAAAFSLFEKYGVTTHFGYDRKVSDSRGSWFCGYTPQDGDRVVVVDDMIHSGQNLAQRLDRILAQADVQISGILVIADVHPDPTSSESGIARIEEQYHTSVYSLVTAKDIAAALQNGIISVRNH